MSGVVAVCDVCHFHSPSLFGWTLCHRISPLSIVPQRWVCPAALRVANIDLTVIRSSRVLTYDVLNICWRWLHYCVSSVLNQLFYHIWTFSWMSYFALRINNYQRCQHSYHHLLSSVASPWQRSHHISWCLNQSRLYPARDYSSFLHFNTLFYVRKSERNDCGLAYHKNVTTCSQ